MSKSSILNSSPIAIVGTSMVFPGNISSLDDMHNSLVNKLDAITEVPVDRWKAEEYYDNTPDSTTRINNKRGGFIENIKGFDAGLFGISPAEAITMDPQIRISMELAFRAFEDAGYSDRHLKGSATGVYMGVCFNDYRDLCYEMGGAGINSHTITGNTNCCVSGRIAYNFGLQGPCLTIDTACSSSLVAVHYGIKDLLTGEINMALAGGVNIIIRPQNHMAFTTLNALSPDGICYSFDARASGYVRSEGAGMILMKRLEDAITDRDHIIGIIRSSNVNNDGRSRSFTAPSQDAQSRLIQKTLEQAGITAHEVDYIEAHGPGTNVGDPIELTAISTVFDQVGRSIPLYVGSIKSNIGHTESASGIAGLLKALAVVHHRIIYPNIHFENPNPRYPWDKSVIKIPTESVVLEGTVRAGVNSFGISGTNVHLLLETFEGDSPDKMQSLFQLPILLPVSASSQSLLRRRMLQLRDWLADNPGDFLENIASVSRFGPHLPCRDLIWANTPDALLQKISDLAPDLPFEVDYSTAKKVFVFSGQGGLWDGMSEELMQHFPVFRDSMQESLALIREELALELEHGFSHIPDDEVPKQLLTFCYQLALAEMLEFLGIIPDIVIGHSLGEVVAACYTGLISKSTAIRITEARASTLNLIAGKGTMWVVGMSWADFDKRYAANYPTLDVAVENGPTTLVLSGPAEHFRLLAKELDEQDIFNQQTRINFAGHSRYVEEVIPFFRDKIKDLKPGGKIRQTKVFSTSLLKYIDTQEINEHYWIQNITSPVRYKDAVEAIGREGAILGIEVCSHSLLAGVSSEILESFQNRSVFLPVIIREKSECSCILQFIRSAYIRNIDIDWDAIFSPWGDRKIVTPLYPMEKREYWIGKDILMDQKIILVESETKSPDDWKFYLKQWISFATLIPIQDIEEDQSFRNLGLDSLMILKLKKQLENQKGISLSSAVFWNYPDIHSLSVFLANQQGGHSHKAKKTVQVEMSDEDINNELDSLIEELL
jgi:acyl transferase domain-containing protein/acyl carrier protein